MKSPICILHWSYLVGLLGSLAVAACGGNYVAADGTGGDAGSDSGSDSSGGTNSGSGGSSGGSGSGGSPAGTGGDGPTCCLAEAVCNDNDVQIESEAACPVGATCYSATACCSTIWCMEEQALCDAIPVCLADEVEVTECPVDAVCTSRALCGTTILCQKTDIDCDREDEPDRHYVAESPDSCALIDYICPEHTSSFSNDCGCGCEQPSECPDFVDCEPGGMVDPLCDSEECPYSDRAF